VIGGSIQYYRHAVGEKKMTQLLAGDKNIQFAKIEIEYQQRKVHCVDPIVLSYLADAVRYHSTFGGSAGVVYLASFTFADGGVFVTDICLFGEGFSISIPADAAEPTFPTHDILLTAPTPPQVTALYDFLSAPPQKMAGKTLNLANGQAVIH
jgi:hypothetical protein